MGAAEVAADLAHVPELPAEYDAWTAPWRGYELHFYSLERVRFFNGFAWSRASARAWHLPLGAVAAYALMIPLLRRVRRRDVNAAQLETAAAATSLREGKKGDAAVRPSVGHQKPSLSPFFAEILPDISALFSSSLVAAGFLLLCYNLLSVFK